jgi:hypothetical protein
MDTGAVVVVQSIVGILNLALSCAHSYLFSLSALQTFRKETDDGEELTLHGSEVASLMNLVATDTLVEEAVALIPSLARFPEAAMDEILDLIRSTMIRIVS